MSTKHIDESGFLPAGYSPPAGERASSQVAGRIRRAFAALFLAALVAVARGEHLAAQTPSQTQFATAPRTATFTLDTAVSAALDRSADVVDARASVESARLNLELSSPWRKSSLSAQANLAPDNQGTPIFSWSLNAAAPLVTGLTLGASVSEKALSASATLSPFSKASTQASDTLAKSLLSQADIERQTAVKVRKAYWTAWLATLDVTIQKKKLELAEARSETTTINASAGVASQADLIDADSKRMTAEMDVLNSQDEADTALADLSRLVGRILSPDELAEPDPGIDRALQGKDEWMKAQASLASLGIDLATDTRSAEPALPDLRLSGQATQKLGTTSGQSFSWSATASVSIDPDTLLRGQDRASKLKLDQTRRKIAESTQNASENYDSLASAIASARSRLNAVEKIGTTAQLNYDKNSYQYQVGAISGTDLLNSEIALLQAKYNVSQARSALSSAIDTLDGRLVGVPAK